jgi:protein SCO1
MARNLTYGAILLMAGLLLWLLLFLPPETPPLAPGGVPASLREVPKGGDFALDSPQGSITLGQFRGRVVALYFGYTTCPDICPSSLGYLAAALNGLTPQELEQVQGLFVSVDPQRDTLEQLRAYTGYFHPNLLGATGPPEVLAEMAQRYGAAYRIVAGEGALGYTVDHSADLYLIDRQGRLRRTLRHGAPPEELVGALRQLLTDS